MCKMEILLSLVFEPVSEMNDTMCVKSLVHSRCSIQGSTYQEPIMCQALLEDPSFLQSNWPILLKNVNVIKYKEKFRNIF